MRGASLFILFEKPMSHALPGARQWRISTPPASGMSLTIARATAWAPCAITAADFGPDRLPKYLNSYTPKHQRMMLADSIILPPLPMIVEGSNTLLNNAILFSPNCATRWPAS